MKQHFALFFRSYSDVFFIHSSTIGIFFFLTSFYNQPMALSGMLSVLAAYSFAKLIGMQEYLHFGFYTYNPLLVGFSIGYLFDMTPITLLLAIIAGIFTFTLTIIMANLLTQYTWFPVLSLPFAIVSSMVYLASSQYAITLRSPPTPWLEETLSSCFPYWISGFLQSLGAIFFLPFILPGLILASSIFLFSRIAFFLAILGFYGGTGMTMLMEGWSPALFLNTAHFNYILIAIAVGGIFTVPALRSYLLALVAVLLATMIAQFTKTCYFYYNIPGFALPFNITTLSVIALLRTVHYPLIAYTIQSTPEKNLDNYLSTMQRGERAIALPFSGKWMVWQGFNGKWTHKLSQKYAYDFVIVDEHGQTCRNKGRCLEDYYAYRKPVISPIEGRVCHVVDNRADNPIGSVDQTHVWGNAIIIEEKRGFFVEISHFIPRSIEVKRGDWVEKGERLGLCGNSGYSPQPHIHIQVQLGAFPASNTIPFCFTNYAIGDQFYSSGLPQENSVVEALYCDKTLNAITSFMAEDQYEYEIWRAGKQIDRMRLKVKKAAHPLLYFESKMGKLYFEKYEGTLFFRFFEGKDPHLKQLFFALPQLPLVARKQLQWSSRIPLHLVESGLKKELAQFTSSFYHDFGNVQSQLAYVDTKTIKGCVTSRYFKMSDEVVVELDEFVGFRTVQVGNTMLKRKEGLQIRG